MVRILAAEDVSTEDTIGMMLATGVASSVDSVGAMLAIDT